MIDYRLLVGDGEQHSPLSDDQLAALYRFPDPDDRPWVRTNFVSTLDGAAQGADGRSGSINTAADRQVFALQRAQADVILVGAGTARAERYRRVDLQPWQRELRRQLGLVPCPTLAVVSHSRQLPDDLAAPIHGTDEGPIDSTGDPDPTETGPVLILSDRQDRLAPDTPPTPAGAELVELDDHDQLLGHHLIDALAERGLRRILCEGGPHLNRQLHAGGLVDEICLTLAPTVIGGAGSRTTAGALLDPDHFELAHCIAADDQTLLLRYRRTAG